VNLKRTVSFLPSGKVLVTVFSLPLLSIGASVRMAALLSLSTTSHRGTSVRIR
jgi:hypothetical protein